MACDTQLAKGQTFAERMSEIERALRRLEASITNGSVRVKLGANGVPTFVGWNDRDRITDTCAYRSLSVTGSWAMRQAVAKAEAESGRKVNAQAVAAGMHSHDGVTWHKGH